MARGIILHVNAILYKILALGLIPREEICIQKFRVWQGIHLDSILHPKQPNQCFFDYDSPEHNSSASLLTSQPKRNILAVHNPSFWPSIWSIQRGSVFVCEDDIWKILFHVLFCPGHSLWFMFLRQDRFSLRFLDTYYFPDNFTVCFTREIGDSCCMKDDFAANKWHFLQPFYYSKIMCKKFIFLFSFKCFFGQNWCSLLLFDRSWVSP